MAQHTHRVVCSALLLSLIAGCATLSESECRVGDWRQLGYVDGLKGYGLPRLADHGKACARYGIVPDATAWQLGYFEGQVRYCTPRSGYEQGRDGNSYANVCPPMADDDFRPAWEDGRRVAALLSTLAEDDRRSAVYLDAAREGRAPVERPALLTRRERIALDRDYERLAFDYEQVQSDLTNLDAELSARHGAEALQPVLRRY
jgi:hypothetical protein